MQKRIVRSSFDVPYSAKVKLIRSGHIYELTYRQIDSDKLSEYRRYDKDHILHVPTGELISIDHSQTKDDSIKSVKQTVARLRRLVNANFYGEKNELFITLTYAENMTDHKRLYYDFRKFMMKLKYHYYNSDFLYIAAAEPQERGAWHMHVLLKDLRAERLFIPHEHLAELWSHGFVFIQRIQDVDNVGAYLSAYLTNIKDGEKTKKGARLRLYPCGMRIYRASRNCVRPESWYEKYEDVMIYHVRGAEKTYESAYEIHDEYRLLNRIKREQYNLHRKKR